MHHALKCRKEQFHPLRPVDVIGGRIREQVASMVSDAFLQWLVSASHVYKVPGMRYSADLPYSSYERSRKGFELVDPLFRKKCRTRPALAKEVTRLPLES